MALSLKTLIVLAIALVVSVAANYYVLRMVVFPSFVGLEQQGAQKNLDRVRDALEVELSGIASTNGDWANWDDTYQFAADGNQDYVNDNLYYEALAGLRINTFFIYDTAGQVLFGKIYDMDSGEELSTDGFVLTELPELHPLLQHSFPGDAPPTPNTGIILTSYGPMLYSASPILTNNYEGPAHGVFIMGRLLNESLVDALRKQTHVDFQVRPLNGGELSAEEQGAIKRLGANQETVLEDTEYLVSGYALMVDFADAPSVLLRADTPKSVTSIGSHTLRVALAGLAVAGIITMLVMGAILQYLVVGPVSNLTRQVLRIGNSSDLSLRLDTRRGDEIGRLGREFDCMLERLQNAQSQLLDHSFKSGLAEMAAGVLHNARNKLTPLTLRIGRLRKTSDVGSTVNLETALKELAGDDISAERREDLADYVRLATERLVAAQSEVSGQLDEICGQVVSIEALLAEQDEYSHAELVVEPIEIIDLVEEALNSIPDYSDKDISVNVDPNTNSAKPVLAQRFLLKQILVNLVANAADAINRSEQTQGLIEVAAAQESIEGREMVHLQFCDNGHGIELGHLSRLFEQDFTTKTDPKSGRGLHWCANSIRSMNGRITAESDGPGKGAVLHLYMPVATASSKAA